MPTVVNMTVAASIKIAQCSYGVFTAFAWCPYIVGDAHTLRGRIKRIDGMFEMTSEAFSNTDKARYVKHCMYA